MVFNVAAAATSQCVAQQLREASATVIITNVVMLVGLKNNFQFSCSFIMWPFLKLFDLFLTFQINTVV